MGGLPDLFDMAAKERHPLQKVPAVATDVLDAQPNRPSSHKIKSLSVLSDTKLCRHGTADHRPMRTKAACC